MSGIRHSPYSTQARGQRRQRSVRAIPTQNTWTHDIILLAQKDDCVTPSREELDQLKLAGLGKRRIVFQKNGDHDHFLKTLEKEYPKLLSQRGAIEVLRSTTGGAGTRPLSVVPLGPKGYAVQELKAAFGAAAVYVRPVQSDLDQSVDSSSIGRFNVQCVHCQQRIPLCDLREHQDYCGCSFDDEIEVLDNLRSSSISENGSRLAENENAHQSISSPVTTGDSVSISSAPMHQEQSNQYFQSVAGGSSTGTRNIEMEIGVLCEMFPSHERTYLSELLSRHSNIDEALEQLMEETSLENKSAQNLSEILRQFQQLVNEDELHFEVQRDCVWSYAIAFYKKALGDKERLKKKLVVSFEGEEGVDAGAISAEFFRIALEQSKKRLFQGGLERVVPVKDATKLMLFRLFGMLLGHSIQQGGPCFPCLCPAVFQYIVGRTEEVQVESRKDDIPVTASTEPLLKLIDDLDNSATKESLEEVLDNDTAWAIISASHWPDTTVVSLSNKGMLRVGMHNYGNFSVRISFSSSSKICIKLPPPCYLKNKPQLLYTECIVCKDDFSA